MTEKVTKGLSTAERKQVDFMSSVNDYEQQSITADDWAGFSITAVLAHLVECSSKGEVQRCLNAIESEPAKGRSYN